MRKLFKSIAAAGLLCGAMTGPEANAVELLINGNLEVDPLPGWKLQEFRTDSTASVDSASQYNAANRAGEIEGEFGLWLKPWGAGDTTPEPVNAILSQTVPAVAGESYTYSAWSKWQQRYAGGVEFLDVLSPNDPAMTGTVPSPTETTMELAFLDASNAVLGSPVMLDLRSEQTTDNIWLQHTLMGMAPAGTTNVRVTASMLDGVFNADPDQSAFLDDFALSAASAPATDLLTNGNFSTQPLPFPTSFTLTELPAGRDTAGSAEFANHTTGGSNGFWLKSFSGTVADPSDAIFSQTVAGAAGTEYTLSAWSKFEAKYSGGVTTLDAASSSGAVASPTQTFLEIAFLDASSAVIGTPVSLDLRTVQMNDVTWREHTLAGTAPTGTVSVQISAKMIDGVSNTDAQSAFFDDFSLTAVGGGTPGDYDGNGIVDGNDFLVIQREFGSTTSAADLDLWKANFGNGAAVPAVGAVPEPATAGVALLGAAVVGMFGRMRRRTV